MTQTLLARLKELQTQRTQGVWRYHDNGFDGGIASDANYSGFIFGGEPCEGRIEPDDKNAAFVIALANSADAIIALIEAAASFDAEVLIQKGGDYSNHFSVPEKSVELLERCLKPFTTPTEEA